MANYTSTHTGATIDASVTIVSGSGVTQSDLTKLNAVTSSAIELNILDGVTASTAEINILDGLTATTAELNYLDGADSSITTLSLPDNTTITTFGASLIDDADAATARTTLGVDVAGTDNSTDVTLVTTSHDYLSISGQAITLGSIDISDDTNLVGGTGITLTGDTLSTTDSEIVHDNLSGFVANEHIDHSTVSISAGTGLSGGGDLTSTRTLSIDSSVVTLSGTQTLANKSISGTANTISNVHIVDDTINTLTIARGGTGGTTASEARSNLNVDVAGTDNSTDVTLVTTSHDYLSLSGQAITLGQIDISDDTNLVGGDGLALTGDTLSVNVDDSSLEINSDTLRIKALGVTNAMLANSSLSYGGVSVALGSSDATPAFDLSDATSLPIVAGTTGTLSVARGGTGATTASGARTNLNVDVAGTDNSTDVTLVTTSHDYLSLTGQAITLGQIDISDDTNLVGGTGITLTGDTLSTTDSEIVHDNLSGFVSNEHIDHSTVSITAGAGLTGGGDITATRDIAVGAGTGVTVNADDIAIGQDVATSADVTFNSVTADIIGDIRGATKFQAKADVALNKGDAVYISGVSGTTPTVDIADANDSAKMPSFGLAASSVSINASVEIITFGTLAGLNTSAFSVGDILFISTNGTSGNTLTATAPSGESSLIQNIGIVQRSHASAGSIKVGGAGRTNATPNLDDGDIFIGNGSNQAVTASLNTKIEDYLDGGTSTANFDTISVDGAEITATPAELNVLDGITSTTAELNYTDGVTSNIQTQLDAKAPLASPAFTGTATGVNLTLSGDLTVNGSTTTLDTTNLAVEDNLMELNAGVTSNANDSGFLIERGTTGDNAIFMWDESADKFTLGTTTATGTTTGDITLSSTGTLVANVEGNVTGAVTGNADTATTLATARNFSLTGDVTAGAVSFDGSGNVALSTTIAANSVALGTDTTGNYMSDLTEGTGIDITHTPGEGSNGTITLDLTEVGFGGGANRLITDDGDGTVTTEANLTFDGSTLALTGDLNVGSGDFFVDDSAGNVGIGTNSPGEKLTIKAGGDTSQEVIKIRNSSNTEMFSFGLDSNGDGYLNFNTSPGTINTNGGDLVLSPGGNVGIGTNSPIQKLQVAAISTNSIKNALHLSNNLTDSTNAVGNGVAVTMGKNDGTYSTKIATVYEGNNPSFLQPALAFYTMHNTYLAGSETEKMRISSAGNVGIGTSTLGAGAKLNVVSGSSAYTAQFSRHDADDGLFLHSEAEATHYNWLISTQDNVDRGFEITPSTAVGNRSFTTPAFVIKADTGNVGIGNSSPSSKFHVSGGDSRHSGGKLIYEAGGDSDYFRIQRASSTGRSQIQFTDESTSELWRVGLTGGGSEDFSFFDGDTNHLVFDRSANSATFGGQVNIGGALTGVNGLYGASSTLTMYNNTYNFKNASSGDMMSLTSTGLGIGTTLPQTKLHISSGATDEVLRLEGTGSPYFSVYDSGIRQFFLQSSGNTVNFYAENDNTIAFFTSGNRALDIDADRNLKFADNGTNPTAVINTAFLFNDGGELKVLDEVGNTTTISPHNFSLIPGGASEERAWGYYSEKDIVDDEGNVTATQKVNVDMMKLARLVEQLTGEKLVYTEED